MQVPNGASHQSGWTCTCLFGLASNGYSDTHISVAVKKTAQSKLACQLSCCPVVCVFKTCMYLVQAVAALQFLPVARDMSMLEKNVPERGLVAARQSTSIVSTHPAAPVDRFGAAIVVRCFALLVEVAGKACSTCGLPLSKQRRLVARKEVTLLLFLEKHAWLHKIYRTGSE